MQYKYLLTCLLIFSSGIFTFTEPVKAQSNTRIQRNRSVRSPHIYMQASSMAFSLVHGCITESRLDDCEKLDRMENTLRRWCSQNDLMACETTIHISKLRAIEQTGNALKSSKKINYTK